MRRSLARIFTLALAIAAPIVAARADAVLRGSLRSMARQHDVAVQGDLDFVRTRAELARLVAAGELVAIEGNADYVVDGQAPHRFARPEIRLFLERLGAQYHAATGTRLVVTSLVRPADEQPSNAHRLSVHPAGMAIDFRVPAKAAHRQWLESALLGLEQQAVLDVTRERRPPHYHVAVYPDAYRAFVARRAPEAALAAETPMPAAATSSPADSATLDALLASSGERGPVDATDRRSPNPAKAPIALAGLALGFGSIGVVRNRRRRGERRRGIRSGTDRRRA